MGFSISDDDQKKTFSRRALIIGAAQGGLLVMLGARLGWLQLAQGGRYKMLSDKNRIDLKMIAPSRGKIIDCNGKEIATNVQDFRVLIIPEQAKNPDEALKYLQTLISLTDEDIARVKDNMGKVAKFSAVQVRDQLSWEDLSRIEVNLPDLPGLSIDVGEIRSYPLGQATAHIIGYVGAPNESEVDEEKMFTLPGFKMGKTGIERHLDKLLRGKHGLSEVEVNVSGREVRELSRQPSLKGTTIKLAVDADLQTYVQEVLARDQSSSAVVMDAHTGAVYALASHPSFDPNLFVKGMSAETWESLLAQPGYPLTNKAVSGQYPPASTFKMITGLAALKEGIVDAKTTFYCPGHLDFKGQRFHCWKKEGHGWVDVKDALSESCDVYFYEIAARIHIDKIAETARILGLGSKLGIELDEERAGLVPDKGWKMGYYGEVWNPGETLNASIGQGYLQATPLQLAVMTARLVNGGKAIVPHLVKQTAGQQQIWPDMPFDAAHLELVKKGMEMAVNDEKGTAGGSRITQTGMEMGGKTGTAQVRSITAVQRATGVRNEDLQWNHRHHALFVGYAPVHNPRYVCSVVVEHGVGGSRAAAPMGRDILLLAQQINPAGTTG
jgi:penicillin-binding protein 2